MSKIRLLLLCGGRSDEHEVSISSARSVLQAVGDRLEVVPLVIDRGGRLLTAADSLRALERGAAPGGSGTDDLATLGRGEAGGGQFDVVFPLLHGPNGEDGTIQGLLELIGVPYVGSGVLASSVGMDKLMMKSVFCAEGLPQVPYQGLSRARWHEDRAEALQKIDLPLPVFVKPANLGSSVGIAKAGSELELEAAIDQAFRHDRRVIVEEAVQGARELEIAVLGNDEPRTSPIGEVRFGSEFYDYGTKYTEGLSELLIPAPLPDGVSDRITRVARRAYRAVDAAGLARIDFFYLEPEDTLYLNEINTMPGFTTTSMYPKLWEAAGVSYSRLVEELVDLALQKR